ncbi:hypothetical protein IVB43_30860 [Bradyrhizobium sp. 48]|uniref:hypothetical protein n=1 Tax=Bradyrhizobium sp. 48 TaxID=2782676 RepID=UPI001FF70C2F|nr:hypothetical protein [Bradyrhizobium sp. 48]MCK1446769.1 hypothetical protein [Bradyrhizobium sp. 48]
MPFLKVARTTLIGAVLSVHWCGDDAHSREAIVRAKFNDHQIANDRAHVPLPLDQTALPILSRELLGVHPHPGIGVSAPRTEVGAVRTNFDQRSALFRNLDYQAIEWIFPFAGNVTANAGEQSGGLAPLVYDRRYLDREISTVEELSSGNTDARRANYSGPASVHKILTSDGPYELVVPQPHRVKVQLKSAGVLQFVSELSVMNFLRNGRSVGNAPDKSRQNHQGSICAPSGCLCADRFVQCDAYSVEHRRLIGEEIDSSTRPGLRLGLGASAWPPFESLLWLIDVKSEQIETNTYVESRRLAEIPYGNFDREPAGLLSLDPVGHGLDLWRNPGSLISFQCIKLALHDVQLAVNRIGLPARVLSEGRREIGDGYRSGRGYRSVVIADPIKDRQQRAPNPIKAKLVAVLVIAGGYVLLAWGFGALLIFPKFAKLLGLVVILAGHLLLSIGFNAITDRPPFSTVDRR